MMCQVLNSAISHNTFYKSSCRADRLPIKNFNLTKYSNETQCKPNLSLTITSQSNYNILRPLAQKNDGDHFEWCVRCSTAQFLTIHFINHLVEPTGYLLKILISRNILTKHNANPISRLGKAWTGCNHLVCIYRSRLDSKDRLIPPHSIFNMWAGVKAWVVINKLQELSLSEGSFH